MRFSVLIVLMIISFLVVGCALDIPTNSDEQRTKALIDSHQLGMATYNDVKKAVGMGTRESAKAILIDACPHIKYLFGTIPSSINIPDTEITSYIYQLNNVEKDKELIVFCGGLECDKGAKVAMYLHEKGYLNVKLYLDGEPEWHQKNYTEVGLMFVQQSVQNNNALLIDARPYFMYVKGTIPGALSITDTEAENLQGRLPRDTKTKIIIFGEGYHCIKSHNLAKKLQSFEYESINVYAGGYSEWKESELQMTDEVISQKIEVHIPSQKNAFIEGVKLGNDLGTVDGEWFKAHILNDTVPNNVFLVDVRLPQEYIQGHIKGAVNLDVASLSASSLSRILPKDKIVIFTCQAGNRSLEAFYKLKKAGVNIERIFYFNANFTCNLQNQCNIKLNKPLGTK